MTKCSPINRWQGFDYIKGILIILVFLGHIIPGSISEVFVRYAIYSFHMPLFIGISGFLFNVEKRIHINARCLLSKYWRRILCPWLIAVFVFFVANHIGNWSFENLKRSFIRPNYHLWYVLGLMSYIVLSYVSYKIFTRCRYGWFLYFGMALLISIISWWDLTNTLFLENTTIYRVYDWVRYELRLYNYVFFVIGNIARHCYENRKYTLSPNAIRGTIVVTVFLIVMRIVMFFYSCPNIQNVLFFVMNFLILLLVIEGCVLEKFPHNRIVEFMGQYSLPIYLYHVLCKIFSERLFERGTGLYYVAALLTFVGGCALVYLLRRIKWIDRVLFGNINVDTK